MTSKHASVYVHFPWCLAKCPYCDFTSYAAERASIDSKGYADAVVREIALRADTASGRRIGSVFFGGGTPSLWEPVELGRVLRAIERTFERAPDLEVTVECNPTSLDRVRADALAAVGVNRLSISTQSLDAEQLAYMGRLHDPAGALAAIDAALASRIPRVSTDLIFGLPGQSPEAARDQAIALADRAFAGRTLLHLSCYQLTIEPNTAFGALAKKGRLPLADDAAVAESFLAIDEALVARGFGHYEISNYAHSGEESRHNLGYWRGEEYVGLGCAAFGMVREGAGGVRYRNPLDPRAYAAAVESKSALREAQKMEPLDAETLLRERIMLGLRLEGGFDLDAAAEDLDVPAWTDERRQEAERLEAKGRLVREGGRLRVPRDQWLWTDDTAARLF